MLTAVLMKGRAIPTNNTIFNVYNETKKRLNSFGIEDYGFEARVIIKHITGFDNKKIMMNYNSLLNPAQLKRLEDIIIKRQARYPLQYILGEWSFYGRTFKVGEGVLIPRADTEIAVETALQLIKDSKAPRILDLCAGSGAIGLTIALEREDSNVTLLEKHSEAVKYCKLNKDLLGVKNADVSCGDVLKGDCSEERYDLIVSNPPYVSESDMKTLQPEVRYEPQTALCPGNDELLFYKEIVGNYGKSVNYGGAFCFEVGINQADSVKEILSSAGLQNVSAVKDYADIDRVVFGTVSQVQ